jgi:hypothetical protein
MSSVYKRLNYPSAGGGGSSSVKDPVSNLAALPVVGNTTNDLRYVVSEENFYRWNGSAWVPQQSGGAGTKFQDIFVIADFILNSGEYWIEYDEATHQKGVSPLVQVLELEAGQYSTIIVTIEITNAGLVRIKIPQVPDLRFNGKIIIA